MKTLFLALDFDGVIGDSIHECLVVGFNAYEQYLGKSGRILTFDKLDEAQVQQARHIRNFIRSGEDYVYIYHALANDITIHSQDDFDAFAEKYSHLRDRFFEVFYKERQFFLDHHRDQWLKLNPLYPGMQEWLEQYAHKENLVIITTKKTEYVSEILKFYHIDIDDQMLYHASPDRPKKRIIASLLDRYNLDPSGFIFIDDQVDTLIKVKPVRVKLFLALWGYNTPDQQKSAHDHKIPGLELEDFLEQNYP